MLRNGGGTPIALSPGVASEGGSGRLPPTRTLYPNGEYGHVGYLRIAVQDFTKPVAMLWRAYDANGRYPTVGYGELTI